MTTKTLKVIFEDTIQLNDHQRHAISWKEYGDSVIDPVDPKSWGPADYVDCESFMCNWGWEGLRQTVDAYEDALEEFEPGWTKRHLAKLFSNKQ